jgi:hypothetical protein
MRMPFGKYQGVELADVPRPYLGWLRRQAWVGAWLVKAIDEILGGGPAGRPGETAEDGGEPGAGDPEPCATFSVRRSGNVGQEILDQDGRIIAWTTDGWAAQVICRLLNENEALLGGNAGEA